MAPTLKQIEELCESRTEFIACAIQHLVDIVMRVNVKVFELGGRSLTTEQDCAAKEGAVALELPEVAQLARRNLHPGPRALTPAEQHDAGLGEPLTVEHSLFLRLAVDRWELDRETMGLEFPRDVDREVAIVFVMEQVKSDRRRRRRWLDVFWPRPATRLEITDQLLAEFGECPAV